MNNVYKVSVILLTRITYSLLKLIVVLHKPITIITYTCSKHETTVKYKHSPLYLGVKVVTTLWKDTNSVRLGWVWWRGRVRGQLPLLPQGRTCPAYMWLCGQNKYHITSPSTLYYLTSRCIFSPRKYRYQNYIIHHCKLINYLPLSSRNISWK